MKIRYLIVLGIIATLFFTIWNFPASFFWQKIQTKEMRISQIQGTIWDAKITGLTTKNFSLDELQLKLNPFYLLIGQLGFDFESHKDGLKITGFSQQDFNFKSTKLKDLKANVNLAKLFKEPFMRNNFIVPIKFDADLVADLPSINWQQKLISAEGKLTLKNIKVANEDIVGLLNATVNTKDKHIVFKINASKKSAIGLDAVINLAQNGKYNATTTVSINETTPKGLRSLLRFFGINDADKTKTLKYSDML